MATNNTINRIELIGYMGAMPELRFTASGTPVTNFSLATNRIWRDQDGEQRKATDWHRITTWGRLAEVVNQYLALGKRVRAPNEARELALTAAHSRPKLHGATPAALLDLFKTADAFRRPERFAELLEVAQLAEPGIDRARVERALRAANSVDAGAIAAGAAAPAEIPKLLDQARLRAIGEA